MGRSDLNPEFPSQQVVFHGFVPRTSTVFFGDPLQLEPIESKGVWCTSTVDDNFHMWDLKYVKYKMLNKNHRSKEDMLTSRMLQMRTSSHLTVDLLEKLHRDCKTEDINTPYTLKADDPKHNYVCFRKALSKSINDELLHQVSLYTNSNKKRFVSPGSTCTELVYHSASKHTRRIQFLHWISRHFDKKFMYGTRHCEWCTRDRDSGDCGI